MKPYYEDDACTIYHADAREYLPTADAVITDPPYGTGKYEHDTDALSPAMLREFGPRAAVFGYPERLIRLCAAAERFPDEWVTWWPTNGAQKGPSFVATALPREVECIACFGPAQWERLRRQRTGTDGFQFDLDRSSANSFHGTQRVAITHDARLGDVWRDAAPGIGFNSHLRLHPNEKSIVVLRRLVLVFTEPGEQVLDPFMGSGTTLRAAKDLGRKAIGIELEERYCEIAARRLAQEVLDFGVPA